MGAGTYIYPTVSGNFLSLSGGTVTGNTLFSANLSATTYFSGSTSLSTIISNSITGITSGITTYLPTRQIAFGSSVSGITGSTNLTYIESANTLSIGTPFTSGGALDIRKGGSYISIGESTQFVGYATFHATPSRSNSNWFLRSFSGGSATHLGADTGGRVDIAVGNVAKVLFYGDQNRFTQNTHFGDPAAAITPTAYVHLHSGSTAAAPLRFSPSANIPSSPNNGDVWYDGTHLIGKFGGQNRELDNYLPTNQIAFGNSISGITGSSNFIWVNSATTLQIGATSATVRAPNTLILQAGSQNLVVNDSGNIDLNGLRGTGSARFATSLRVGAAAFATTNTAEIDGSLRAFSITGTSVSATTYYSGSTPLISIITGLTYLPTNQIAFGSLTSGITYSTGFTYNGSGVTIDTTSDTTGTTDTLLTFQNNSTGVPGTNYGIREEINLGTTTTSNRAAAAFDTYWINAVDETRHSGYKIKLVNIASAGALLDSFSITNDGNSFAYNFNNSPGYSSRINFSKGGTMQSYIYADTDFNWASNGTPGNFIIRPAGTEIFRFNITGATFGSAGAVTPTARVDIMGSTALIPSLRIRSGVTVSAPNDGDIWNDGTHLIGKIGGQNRELDNYLPTNQVGFGSSTSGVTGSTGLTYNVATKIFKANISDNFAVRIASWLGYAGLYFLDEATAISQTNVVLTCDGPNTYLNAPTGGINLRVAGTTVVGITSSLVYSMQPLTIGSNVASTARVDIASATTALASLRLRSSAGVNVTSPNSGDIWYDGTYEAHAVIGLRVGTTPGSGVEALLAGSSIQFNNSTYVAQVNPRTGDGNFANFFGNGQFEIVANNGSGTVLGQTGAKPVGIGTSNLMRVVVSAAGVVNIGGKTFIGHISTAPTALLHITAGTTSAAQLRLQSGVAPTTPNAGDIWNDGTSIVIGGGEGLEVAQLSGTGNRAVQVSSAGTMSAVSEIIEQEITDATTITNLTTGGNWTGAAYTGTAITGTYKGQVYMQDTTYYFLATSDNVWRRLAWA